MMMSDYLVEVVFDPDASPRYWVRVALDDPEFWNDYELTPESARGLAAKLLQAANDVELLGGSETTKKAVS